MDEIQANAVKETCNQEDHAIYNIVDKKHKSYNVEFLPINKMI